MPGLELSIPTTSIAQSPGKPHTLYHVLLRLPIRSFTVQKRYNDFLDLHQRLTELCGSSPPLAPPPKTFLTNTVKSPSLTEERRAALEAYLVAILEAPDSRWRDSPAWRSFLSLPPSWSAASASSSNPTKSAYSSGSGIPSGPITDPTLWLDSHRELKALLHDARIFLAKRDQATSAGEQHDASAGAKRCLVKASSLITALDNGLRGSSSNTWDSKSSEKGELLEGEIRRRRDLISSARKERDGLESLASSMASRRQTSPNPSAPPAEKNALFAGSSKASSGGGRVLGAPLPETEQTRELDNQGVLQLQRQVMWEQDRGIEDLTKVVMRQKEMGLAIGEELDIQNEMLSELGKDVDRVDGKTRVARKRADKIS